METATIPTNWLDFGSWNPAALIELKQAATQREVDPYDRDAVRTLYLDLLIEWSKCRRVVAKEIATLHQEKQHLDELLKWRLM